MTRRKDVGVFGLYLPRGDERFPGDERFEQAASRYADTAALLSLNVRPAAAAARRPPWVANHSTKYSEFFRQTDCKRVEIALINKKKTKENKIATDDKQYRKVTRHAAYSESVAERREVETREVKQP